MTVVQGLSPVVSCLVDLLLEQEVSRGPVAGAPCFDNRLCDTLE